MKMKSVIAHVVFALLLFLFVFGVEVALESAGMNLPWAVRAAELALVIPAALLLAARLGRLGVPGVALAAAAVVLFFMVMVLNVVAAAALVLFFMTMVLTVVAAAAVVLFFMVMVVTAIAAASVVVGVLVFVQLAVAAAA